MRVLFFNEGNIGSHILGQSRLDDALRAGMAGTDGVQGVFAGLAPPGRAARALIERPLPVLHRANLDMRSLRWHLVQSLRARAAIERELRRASFDVVHLHTQAIAFAAGGVMRRLPVALSVDASIRDWSAMPAWPERGAPRLTAASRSLERRALTHAALVIAWTAWARRGLERDEPRANTIEHHPGLELDRFRPGVRRPRENAQVLFVGGRFREKGGEDLLEALSDRLGRDVELHVVTPADGPAPREGLRIHRLGASDPALVELYQQADVLCLPTYGDTNPWVILEAMACATPVVATSVGAIPELLEGDRAGLTVPPGDVRSLREALAVLLGDTQRRAEQGRAGRERCERRYDARRQVPELLEKLRQITERPR